MIVSEAYFVPLPISVRSFDRYDEMSGFMLGSDLGDCITPPPYSIHFLSYLRVDPSQDYRVSGYPTL